MKFQIENALPIIYLPKQIQILEGEDILWK